MNEKLFQQKFKELDHDGDGLITIKDLKLALHHIAKEFQLVLRLEESHPNLSQQINFELFQSYLQEKLSQEATLYHHSSGKVERRSTSAIALETISEEQEQAGISTGKEARFDEVLDILSSLDPDQELFATLLQLHHPNQKNAFSTISLRI